MKFFILSLLLSLAVLQFSDAVVNFVQVTGYIRTGKVQHVADVVQQGFDVNTVGNDKKTLLMHSAISGKPQVARVLLENGAKVNYQEYGTGMTPLMYAALNNNVDVAKILMEFSADRYMKDNKGLTAMDYARGTRLYNQCKETCSKLNEFSKMLVF